MSLPGADAEMDVKRNADFEVRTANCCGAFTLIELLIVITIIAILMALLFPAFKGVQDQAKRTQAKNDLVQIVTAVNAFYAEYGRYPTAETTDADATYGPSGKTNDILFNELRGVTSTPLNPKQIVFINPPEAKDQTNPRAGIANNRYYDPWGNPYAIEIDADYSNDIPNPYSANAGSASIRAGSIAWSFGKDGQTSSADKKVGAADDDVISWQ